MASQREAQIAADEAFARSLQEAEFAVTALSGASPNAFATGGLSASAQAQSRAGASRHAQGTQHPRPHWSDLEEEQQGFSHHHERTARYGDSSFHFESHFHSSGPPPSSDNLNSPAPNPAHLPPVSAFMPGAADLRQGMGNSAGNYQTRNDRQRHASQFYGPNGSPVYMPGRNTRGQQQQQTPGHLHQQRSGRDRVNTARDGAGELRADSALRRLQERAAGSERNTGHSRLSGENYGGGNSASERPRGQRDDQRNEQRGSAGSQDPFAPHTLFGHVFGPGPRGPLGMNDDFQNAFQTMFGGFPDEAARRGRHDPSSEGGRGQGNSGPARQAMPEGFDLFEGMFDIFNAGMDPHGREGAPFGSDGPGTSAGRPGPGRPSPLGPMLSRLFRNAGLFDGEGGVPRTYEDWLQFGENLGAVNRGATDEEIASLPTETVRRPTTDDRERRGQPSGASGSSSSAPSAVPGSVEEEEKCAICLGEFEEGTVIKKLPCSHIFCDECISRWLHLNKECPCCKASIRGSGS